MSRTLFFLGWMSVRQSHFPASAITASFKGVGFSPTIRRRSSSSQNFQSPNLSRAKIFFDAL